MLSSCQSSFQILSALNLTDSNSVNGDSGIFPLRGSSAGRSKRISSLARLLPQTHGDPATFGGLINTSGSGETAEAASRDVEYTRTSQ